MSQNYILNKLMQYDTMYDNQYGAGCGCDDNQYGAGCGCDDNQYGAGCGCDDNQYGAGCGCDDNQYNEMSGGANIKVIFLDSFQIRWHIFKDSHNKTINSIDSLIEELKEDKAYVNETELYIMINKNAYVGNINSNHVKLVNVNIGLQKFKTRIGSVGKLAVGTVAVTAGKVLEKSENKIREAVHKGLNKAVNAASKGAAEGVAAIGAPELSPFVKVGVNRAGHAAQKHVEKTAAHLTHKAAISAQHHGTKLQNESGDKHGIAIARRLSNKVTHLANKQIQHIKIHGGLTDDMLLLEQILGVAPLQDGGESEGSIDSVKSSANQSNMVEDEKIFLAKILDVTGGAGPEINLGKSIEENCATLQQIIGVIHKHNNTIDTALIIDQRRIHSSKVLGLCQVKNGNLIRQHM